MKIAGILIVLIGAVAVYFSSVVRRIFFKQTDDENKTYDMKENFIKIVGVLIAIVGVLMVMYAK